MVTCPPADSFTVTSAGIADTAAVSIPYPATESGDLLLMSIVRGDPFSVPDETPTPTGWSHINHQFGPNNFLHNVYLRVADGTETGNVTVTHSASRASSGLMVRLRGNTGAGSVHSNQFDGALVEWLDQPTAIAASRTPTVSGSLLFYFAGVPNGNAGSNYSEEGMCHLGGVGGTAYLASNHAYAEVITGTSATGERRFSGSEFGAVIVWRFVAGGLIPWSWQTGGPTVGFIGFGTF